MADNTLDAAFMAGRTRLMAEDADARVKSRLAQERKPDSGIVAAEGAIPEFRGATYLPPGAMLLSPKGEGKGSLTENILSLDKGFISGAEKEAADTLSTVPNIAMFAGAGALGAIPAIASYGGTRLLSGFFGLQMGKALWNQYGEYRQALQEEGGLGPRSRELLGRMTITAAFGIQATKHALTEAPAGAPAESAPKKPAKDGGPTMGSLRSGIDPAEAGKKASEELRVNLKYINAADSTKAVIADINRSNAERLTESRKTKPQSVTVEESKSALTIEKALALEEGTPLRDSEIVALRDLRDAAASNVDKLAKATLAGDADASTKLKSAFALAGELEAKRELASRATARALASHKIPSDAARPDIAPEKLSELSDLMGAVDIDPVTLANRLQSLSKAQRTTYMQEVSSVARHGKDIAYEAWLNGLLSSPQTHASNFLSNTLTTLWAIPERAIAGAIGSGEGVQRGEATAMLRGLAEGWGDGIRMAAKALKYGEQGSGKLDSSPEAGQFHGTSVSKGADYFGSSFVRFPTRLLTAGDALFKGINYRMELKAQALREGIAEGLTGDVLSKRVAEIEANPPATIKARADEFALLQTFQNELGRIGQGAMRIRNAVPMGRVIMPFMKTPANIAKWAMHRTPGLNLLSSEYRADFSAGGARRDLALAKMASGAMTMGTFAYLASTGMITGGGPRNAALQRELRDTGWQPYSIKVGDTYYSYNRLDPVGTILGTIADFVEIGGQIPEASAEQLATAMALAFSKNFSSKSYMEGPANVLEAMQSPDRGAKELASTWVRSLVPAGVRAVERVTSPEINEINSLLDSIKASVPGWSDDLPVRRNLFGEPQLLTGGLGPDIVSPIYTSPNKKDPVADEILRVGVRLSMPSRVIAGTRPPDLRMQPERVTEGIELTPQQYDEFVRLAGNELKGSDGLGMKDKLAEMFSSDQYKEQSDGTDGGKATLIERVVSRYRDIARAELIRRHPELQGAIMDRRSQRAIERMPPARRAEIGIAR